MKKHIIINVDECLFVPRCDMTLLEMVRHGEFSWPSGSTCVTQERDGELLWWSAPVNKIKKARKTTKPEKGLIPLIGISEVSGADYFLLNEQEVVAKDWQVAVVTVDQFVGFSN